MTSDQLRERLLEQRGDDPTLLAMATRGQLRPYALVQPWGRHYAEGGAAFTRLRLLYVLKAVHQLPGHYRCPYCGYVLPAVHPLDVAHHLILACSPAGRGMQAVRLPILTHFLSGAPATFRARVTALEAASSLEASIALAHAFLGADDSYAMFLEVWVRNRLTCQHLPPTVCNANPEHPPTLWCKY